MKKRFLPILLVAYPGLVATLAAQEENCCPTRPVSTESLKANDPEKSTTSNQVTNPGYPSSIPDYTTTPEEVIEPAPAQFKAYPDEGLYWIQSGGLVPMKYQLALDELYVGRRDEKEPQYINDPGSYPSLMDLAQSTALTTGKKVYLVAYPAGKERTLANRRLVTHRVLAMVKPGFSDVDAGIAAGAKQGVHYEFAPEYVVYEFADAVTALRGAEILSTLPGVFYVEPALARWRKGNGFTPNDNFYKANYANPLRYPYPPPNTGKKIYQWYLDNSGQNNELPYTFRGDPATFGIIPVRADIRASNAWDFNKGDTVRIAIVDQGLEKLTSSTVSTEKTAAHNDLINRIDLFDNNHWDFLDDSEDPSPPKASLTFANHGTAVAGLAAATMNNSSGVPAKLSADPNNIAAGSARELAGVAGEAKLYGIRVIEGFLEEVELAQAINWTGKILMNNNTKVDVKHLPSGLVYNDVKLSGQIIYDVASHAWSPETSGPAPIPEERFLMQAFRYVLTKKRNFVNGMGPILVASGFNDGDFHGDQNLSPFLSSGMPLVVGSVTDFGWRPGYDSRGANKAIVVPSSGTFSGIPDEIFPNTEPKICPTSPRPLPVPTYIEYPDNIFAAVPVTFNPGDPIPVTLRFNSCAAGAQPVRRAGQQVVTLANLQKYLMDFEGNSASCGLATGVAALMIRENSGLDWQEVQEIMMRTAEANQGPPWWDAYVPPLDVELDWRPSNNYHPVTHKYGFGVLNAERALLWAQAWRLRGDLTPTAINSPGNNNSRYVGDGGSEEGTTPFSYDDKVLGSMVIAHRARVGIGQPINNNKVFQLSAPPRNFRVEHVLVRVHAPAVRRGPVGIRLIAPPDGPGKPTVISHLHTPKLEDTGTGFVHYRFGSVRHWGTQYTNYNVGRPWLLQFWGAGNTDRISNDHGINITYFGSTILQPNNLPPTLAGGVQTIRMRRGSEVPVRGLAMNVYRQPATNATPAKWKDGPNLKIWFGGFLENFDPLKDSEEDYPLDNPADPNSIRRTRSPHVIKPVPSPLPDVLFPLPLTLGLPGRVPLPEPIYRVKSDGLELHFTNATGPAAGQTMTLSWNGKTITFTATATPTAITDVPTALPGETVQQYSERFAEALGQHPVLNFFRGGDFAIVPEFSDGAGDYVRLMYQKTLTSGESGVITVTNETMANITATPTNRAVPSRYQGGLPAGITFDPRDGTFHGKPVVNGEYEVTVHATNIFDWAPAPLVRRLAPPIGYPNAPDELITPGQPLQVNLRVEELGWTFQAFLSNYFTNAELSDPAISGPGADPDGDGISNLYEYVAGSDPRSPDLLDPAEFVVPYGVEMGDGSITLYWTVDTTATEGSMILQTSTDMVTWEDLASPAPETFGVLNYYIYTVAPEVGVKRFYRLKPVHTPING